MWGRRLAVMLALYTGKVVALEVNFRADVLCMPPLSANKVEPTLALKPRGDVTRSPKQGYQWPHNCTGVQQKIFEIKLNTRSEKRVSCVFQRKEAWRSECLTLRAGGAEHVADGG